MSIRTKIDFSGITSDHIVTSDNKKYIHEDDEIFNSLKDEIAACENAQVQTEIATLEILEIKEDFKGITNEAINTATERAEIAAQNAELAQALSETAALNAIESEQRLEETATERIEEVAENVTFDSQIIAETAAINSLNRVNEATDAQLMAEVAAVDSLRYKSESVKAQLLAEAAAINALVTKQETIQEANEIKEQTIQDVYDKQMLAETAAINALVYLEEARAILEEIKGLQQS